MTAAGYIFGNEVLFREERWILKSTGKEFEMDSLVCPKCKKMPAKAGHDPCIANLPGVDAACCGHGVQEGYAMFKSGKCLRGEFDK